MLHEEVSWVGALGAGMIMIGVFTVAVEKKQKPEIEAVEAAVRKKERIHGTLDGTELASIGGIRKDNGGGNSSLDSSSIEDRITERSRLLN